MATLIRFLRSRLGWLLVISVFVGLLVLGASAGRGPQTQEERADSITSQIACPICDGESVFESRNAASRAIRNEVDTLVRANEMSDRQILQRIENTYGREVMLVPESTGFDAVAWIAPIAVAVIAVVGLVAAFVRWRSVSSSAGVPTDDDRLIVESALRSVARSDVSRSRR